MGIFNTSSSIRYSVESKPEPFKVKSKHRILKLPLLFRVSEHVKNYRPKLLLFSGPPSSRPSLVHFANLITKRISLLSTTHIVKVMMVMVVMMTMMMVVMILLMMLLSPTHFVKEKDIDWPEVDALRTSAQEWCLRNKVDF